MYFIADDNDTQEKQTEEKSDSPEVIKPKGPGYPAIAIATYPNDVNWNIDGM